MKHYEMGFRNSGNKKRLMSFLGSIVFPRSWEGKKKRKDVAISEEKGE